MRLVELVEPSKFVARLQEPTVAGDPTSGQHEEQLPTYNAYSVDGDVTAPLVYVPPPKEEVPPYVNFAPLQNGSEALTRAAEHYQRALKKAEENGGAALARASLAAVNQKLLLSERALTSSDGLPNRPWFKHQVYAPGAYTGYGVKTIPAVREAIEQKQWLLADAQAVRVGKVLATAAAAIDGAASALEQALK